MEQVGRGRGGEGGGVSKKGRWRRIGSLKCVLFFKWMITWLSRGEMTKK